MKLSFTGVIAVACSIAAATSAVAQDSTPRGSVAGTVRGSDGQPLPIAQVRVAGTELHAITDDNGVYRLSRLPIGRVSLRVTRIGYRPASLDVVVTPGAVATADFELEPAPAPLGEIVVHPIDILANTGFYRRRETTSGHFVTRAELERLPVARATDAVHKYASVRMYRDVWGRNRLRFRGARCDPMVYLDGVVTGAGYYDIDLIDVRDIEGLEIYSGAASVPPEFSGLRGQSACGAIVLWFGPRPNTRRARQFRRDSVAMLVESMTVYWPDEVDRTVSVREDNALAIDYPDSLHQVGLDGVVETEFVVDTAGAVEMHTLSVKASPHPLFTASVARALRNVRFTPAVRRGKSVRQLVMQDFVFVVNESVP